MNTKQAIIYYNKGNVNLFRVRVDVTLSCLKDQLNQIYCCLNHGETRRVDNVKNHRLSIDLRTCESKGSLSIL